MPGPTAFYSYPPAMPVSEMLYLAGILRGATLDADSAIQAGWVVVGYAKSQITLSGVTAGEQPDKPKMSKTELADALESAANPTPGMKAIPWGAILATVLPYLIQWIEKKIG